MVQDGGEDEDYFAHFEDLEFTEEDLARIDHACGRDFHAPALEPALPLPELKGKAQTMIEVERELQPILEAAPLPLPPRSPMPGAPYSAFRGGKPFSVSDLIGPLWCVDVQGYPLGLTYPLCNIP